MSNNITSNQYLWNNKHELENLFKDSMEKSEINGECLFSTYKMSGTSKSGPKKSTTKYPTIHRKCEDKRRRSFYSHHISMLHKHQDEGNPNLWDSKTLHVSHLCHQTLCIKKDHLMLMTQNDNNSRNISCIGKVICIKCSVQIQICQHTPKCVTIVSGICSNCPN